MNLAIKILLTIMFILFVCGLILRSVLKNARYYGADKDMWIKSIVENAESWRIL